MTREQEVDKILDELQEDFLKVDIPLMDKMTLFAKVQNAVNYVKDLSVEPQEWGGVSVIEKIHDAIDKADSDGYFEDEHGCYIGSVLTDYHVHEIIDTAVKECTHE